MKAVEQYLQKAGWEAFEAKEAKRDFEKGEISEAAKMLLQDIEEDFFWFDNARNMKDTPRAEELRQRVTSSVSALLELLKDRPSAK